MATAPGIPPRKWIAPNGDRKLSLSNLYSLWERGEGPRSVKVGGKRLVLESWEEYLARLQTEQREAA